MYALVGIQKITLNEESGVLSYTYKKYALQGCEHSIQQVNTLFTKSSPWSINSEPFNITLFPLVNWFNGQEKEQKCPSP